jgi:hypothetical protein
MSNNLYFCSIYYLLNSYYLGYNNMLHGIQIPFNYKEMTIKGRKKSLMISYLEYIIPF